MNSATIRGVIRGRAWKYGDNINTDVLFPGKYTYTVSESADIARHALERVGLAHYAANYPHHLSGGEQQRVALARALVPRPQVMLMDEPFSGLDQRLRESVRAETLTLLRETLEPMLQRELEHRGLSKASRGYDAKLIGWLEAQ